MRQVSIVLFLALCIAAHAESLQELKALAQQRDANAQILLGKTYAGGKGVPEDDAEAVKWYRKAAEQGESDAQVLLGEVYDIGDGVHEDAVKAYAWYNVAGAAGESVAKRKEALQERMTNEQVAEAQRLSRELREKYSKKK